MTAKNDGALEAIRVELYELTCSNQEIADQLTDLNRNFKKFHKLIAAIAISRGDLEINRK